MSFWGIAYWHACKMWKCVCWKVYGKSSTRCPVITDYMISAKLQKCSTWCHLKLWSLGLPYSENVLCMGTVRNFLNILNRCAKMYSQMISLLFLFCQLVAMRVWWMKACTVMLQWSHAIWFVQNWSITPACSTFWSAFAIYRSQRIWSTECPVNHMWCHGCLCWALAKFMVMWRWEKALLNEFLNWRLKMLLVCASI